MNIFNAIKKKASRIGKDDSMSSVSLITPPIPSPPSVSYAAPLTPPPPVPRKGRRRIHPKSPGPPLPSKEQEFTLDTNLDEMEGIVDLTIRHDGKIPNGEGSSPGSGFETSNVTSSSLSISDGGMHHSTGSTPFMPPLHPQHMMFSNPFLPSATTSVKRKPGPPSLELRKVSPKTVLSSSEPGHQDSEQHSPGWTAPESWAVEKKDGETLDIPDYTTSDDEDLANGRSKPTRRRTRNVKPKGVTFQIRIHRVDGSYHVVKCPLTTTVSELIPIMNKKLVLDSTRETHSLYVKERERGEYRFPHHKVL